MTEPTTAAAEDQGRRPAGDEQPRQGRLAHQDHPAVHLLAVDRSRRSALFITSFRPLDAANTSGWWTVFTHPSHDGPDARQLPRGDRRNANMGRAFINSLAIALPATFIPILIAAFAAYAFTFMEFPGRDVLFLHRSSACWSCPTTWPSCRSSSSTATSA